MAEAKDKAAWNRTFAIMAQIRNTVVAHARDAVNPMEFYPWTVVAERVNAPPPTPAQEAALSEVFPLTSKGR